MDSIDLAQRRSDYFHQLAMEHRHFDLAPVPPERMDQHGNALCIDCDANINQRRQVIPNTQRCVDCQNDFEKQRSR